MVSDCIFRYLLYCFLLPAFKHYEAVGVKPPPFSSFSPPPNRKQHQISTFSSVTMPQSTQRVTLFGSMGSGEFGDFARNRNLQKRKRISPFCLHTISQHWLQVLGAQEEQHGFLCDCTVSVAIRVIVEEWQERAPRMKCAI